MLLTRAEGPALTIFPLKRFHLVLNRWAGNGGRRRYDKELFVVADCPIDSVPKRIAYLEIFGIQPAADALVRTIGLELDGETLTIHAVAHKAQVEPELVVNWRNHHR